MFVFTQKTILTMRQGVKSMKYGAPSAWLIERRCAAPRVLRDVTRDAAQRR
jgi:hypothetical protein